MKAKRIITLLCVALTIAFTLTACGGSDDAPADSPSAAEEQTDDTEDAEAPAEETVTPPQN